MKVLFINPYIYLPGEKAIKRTFYLFDMLLENGIDATFLTSDFNHYEKKTREIEKFYTEYPKYKDVVKFVHMPPYSKNISFKRYFCNLLGDVKVVEWVKNNGDDFDIVYITWPASYIVRHLRKYCDEHKIKMVLDINDLWPDSMRAVIKNDYLYNLLTFPMQINTKKAFSYADGLVAVSEEYLDIASRNNRKAKEKLPVYIGSILEEFDAGVREYSASIEKKDGEIWLTYVGTLGTSYDIDTVILAISQMEKMGITNIKFKILGHGPNEKYLRELVQSNNIKGVEFLGFLDYKRMAAYLDKSDICMNCLKQRASQSIINKIADYFASGNPVLNCGACIEMRYLITNYATGMNYEAENVEDCISSVLKMTGDKERMKIMGQNARRLALEKFDRRKTHKQIIDMLERMLSNE